MPMQAVTCPNFLWFCRVYYHPIPTKALRKIINLEYSFHFCIYYPPLSSPFFLSSIQTSQGKK
ncbi:hypothetical protein CW304_01930 [Bacillus sp. UFRGS-B20]|nr:hypothetical protein CW304_01930 [Bacillus sp. UFRGS-B20]